MADGHGRRGIDCTVLASVKPTMVYVTIRGGDGGLSIGPEEQAEALGIGPLFLCRTVDRHACMHTDLEESEVGRLAGRAILGRACLEDARVGK